jgi:hypothetical protein
MTRTRYESTLQARQLPQAAQSKPKEEGTGKMRTAVKAGIALTALFTSTLFAMSGDMPVLNVVPVCRGIAAQAANPTEKGGPDLDFKNCISSEQEVRDQLAKVWSTFQPADKGHCVRLAQTGGESSYTELITCLEMARDVRTLRPTGYTKID